MRCWSGPLPVAIVVQTTGESSGSADISGAYAPCCRIFAKFGSLPSDINRKKRTAGATWMEQRYSAIVPVELMHFRVE